MGRSYTTAITFGSSQAPTPKSRQATPAKPPQEYDRFMDLTRKIVSVPKTEVDAKREKS